MRQCVQSSQPRARHTAGNRRGLPLLLVLWSSPAARFPRECRRMCGGTTAAAFPELVGPLLGQRMRRVWKKHLTLASSAKKQDWPLGAAPSHNSLRRRPCWWWVPWSFCTTIPNTPQLKSVSCANDCTDFLGLEEDSNPSRLPSHD